MPRAPAVQAQIATYFRAINERNRAEYATLRAPPAPPGTPHYVGIEACRDCHEDAYAVWARTPHSHAYRTLEDSSKNFNLSCVGCHVTGYRQPGGSEVVQNEGLRDVQCESCHGPGSAHVAARPGPARRTTITLRVPGEFCATSATACHSASMVEFDAPLSSFSGVTQCTTSQADTVVGSVYTPGAGNIW